MYLSSQNIYSYLLDFQRYILFYYSLATNYILYIFKQQLRNQNYLYCKENTPYKWITRVFLRINVNCINK